MKEEIENKNNCCDECWNSRSALKGAAKKKFGCGLSCECHLLKKSDRREHLPTIKPISTQKENIVAILEFKATAIDFTPIYFIRTIKAIKAGSVLKWDTALKKIILE